ncbi:MAG: hypothetical protein CMG41_01905 [Candidatus Marinimicrobia bacterium]|nr:hypothetical protein [Candidatus Neomarinimicrobiota bacterium]
MPKKNIGPAISSGNLKTEYKPNTKPEITNIQNSITRNIQNVIFIFFYIIKLVQNMNIKDLINRYTILPNNKMLKSIEIK